MTIEIAFLALVFALLLAIPSGVWAAYREGSRFDSVSGGVAAGVISIPPFLLALFLIFFFVFHQGIVRYAFLVVGGLVALRIAWGNRDPASGRGRRFEGRRLLGAAVLAAVVVVAWAFWPDFPRIGFVRLTSGEGLNENLRSAFLPALALGLTEFAVFSRLLRSDMVTVLQEDYILSARAKGMPTRPHPPARRAAAVVVLAADPGRREPGPAHRRLDHHRAGLRHPGRGAARRGQHHRPRLPDRAGRRAA